MKHLQIKFRTHNLLYKKENLKTNTLSVSFLLSFKYKNYSTAKLEYHKSLSLHKKAKEIIMTISKILDMGDHISHI